MEEKSAILYTEYLASAWKTDEIRGTNCTAPENSTSNQNDLKRVSILLSKMNSAMKNATDKSNFTI